MIDIQQKQEEWPSLITRQQRHRARAAVGGVERGGDRAHHGEYDADSRHESEDAETDGGRYPCQ